MTRHCLWLVVLCRWLRLIATPLHRSECCLLAHPTLAESKIELHAIETSIVALCALSGGYEK
jgi:hypothetical protein